MAPNVGKTNRDKVGTADLFDEIFVRGEDVSEEVAAIMQRLKINGGDLVSEAEDQAPFFARVAVLAEQAQSEANALKRDWEVAKARADKRIRHDSEKKPPEDEIKQMLVIDLDSLDAYNDYLLADRDARILKALAGSVKDRRDLIVELMRDARAESRAYGGGE